MEAHTTCSQSSGEADSTPFVGKKNQAECILGRDPSLAELSQTHWFYAKVRSNLSKKGYLFSRKS